MTFSCPKGHQSVDADYCSECGLRLGAASTIAANPGAQLAESDTTQQASTDGGDVCPVCDTPRVAGARFCEVCRHDFTGAPLSTSVPSTPMTSATPPDVSNRAAPVEPPFVGPLGGIGRNPWALVKADPARMTEAERAAPDAPIQRAFPLDLDENLVGRRNGKAGLHPEIPIADPSVSSRHLKICRRPDGDLYAVDLGSTNGSLINDVVLEPGVETALKPGDQLAIGQWTLIEIETR